MNHSIVADAILEEMFERDWSIGQVAIAAGKTTNPEYGTTVLSLQMYLCVDDPNLRLGGDLIADLAKAFDVPKELFANLEAKWIASQEAGRVRKDS